MSYQSNCFRLLIAVSSAALLAIPLTVKADTKAAARPAAPPITLDLPSKPPAGAIVLFSGQQSELQNLWLKRYTKDPTGWKAHDSIASPADKSDMVTKQEFGDCYLHVEFRCPKDGEGNSGVGFQGRYEVQILNSYGKDPEAHGCAAFYSQKAPRVTASRAPYEWQTYDIFFRAPRFNDKGEVVEKPRATVIQNGIIVQNNEEFTDMTGIQYGEYKNMTPTGPLILQGDHDQVDYRNIWIVPM